MYGIDLPPVSAIPGLKATRKKAYDGYYAYVFLSTAGELDFKRIAEIHQLPTGSDQDWLETIESSVVFVLEIFLSLIGCGRFSANPASKLKFEIYGGRLLGFDKAIGAIVTTIKDLLEGFVVAMEVSNTGLFYATYVKNRFIPGSYQFGPPHPK